MENLCVTLQTSCNPQKRGARDLTSTSPEPYHEDGMRMDWLTGTPFVRQQPYEGPSICVLCCSSLCLPLVGPESQPCRSERGRARESWGTWIGHLLSIVLRAYPRLPCQSASAVPEIRRLFLPLPIQEYNHHASRAQALCTKCAVDCQPGMVAWLPCNPPEGQPCTDKTVSNQRQEPSSAETVIPCHGPLGLIGPHPTASVHD